DGAVSGRRRLPAGRARLGGAGAPHRAGAARAGAAARPAHAARRGHRRRARALAASRRAPHPARDGDVRFRRRLDRRRGIASRIVRSLSGALDALEFLTIVRARRRMPDLDEVAAAQAWFPAIGLLLGLALLGADRAASRALPPAAIDVLLVVLLAALTGALHLDGLGDAADGLLGGRDRERRLAIMREPHAGSYAIVAIVSVLALKWAGLVALPGNVRFEALLLAPCLARLGMLAATAAFPYARAGGMGVEFKGRA